MVGNIKNLKNVIFLVGDGMGLLFNIVYCYYKNDLYVKEMIFIVFDLYLKGINCIYLNDLK